MEILRFTFNPFGVNTYIVYDTDTMECAIIDPGMMNDEEIKRMQTIIERYRLKPVHLINTHLHADHAMGDKFVKEHFGLKLKAHRNDTFLAEGLSLQKQLFGIADDDYSETIDEYLNDGDIIRIGNGQLKVLEVPGHTPGGIVLYDEADKFVVTGDSLFQGSIGRTDLPGGDMSTLINAIAKKLMTLPDDTIVYSGHGGATTIGEERRHNPFLQNL